MNSSVGKRSSVGLLLNYRFNHCAAEALTDHDYCSNKFYDSDTTNISSEKIENTCKFTNEKYNSKIAVQYDINHATPNVVTNLRFISQIIEQNTLEMVL